MTKNNDRIKGVKQYDKYIWILSSIAVVGVLLLWLSKNLDFMFISNDDIYIRAILSGDLTGTPDAHTIYILYPLAWVLALFYEIFPNINWYGIFTTGMYAICWIVILYRAILISEKTWKRIRNFFLAFFFLLIFNLQYLIYSQYTVLAGILGCTAVFLFVTIKNDNKWTEYIPVIIFFTISFLTRSKIALMYSPFIVCFAFYKVGYEFFEKKNKQNAIYIIKKYILLFTVVGIFWGGLFSIHSLAYHTNEWNQFEEYNKYRTEVYDYYSYPDYEDNKEFYSSLDIQEEEMYLIQSANLSIDENITVEKMKAIYLKSKESFEWNQQFYSVPRKVVFDYLDSFFDVNRAVIFLYRLYGAAIFLALIERKNTIWISFTFLFLIRSMLRGYLIYRGRFPERVSYPLTLIEITLLIGMMIHASSQSNYLKDLAKERNRGSCIFTMIFMSFMLLLVIDVYKENLDRNITIKNEADWTANLFPYLEENIENNYLLEVQSMATLKAPMFGKGTNLPKNAIYIGGWLQKSPLIQEQYNNRLHAILEDEVLKEDNIFFIQKQQLSILWMEEYFKTMETSIHASIVTNIELNGNEVYSVIQLK